MLAAQSKLRLNPFSPPRLKESNGNGRKGLPLWLHGSDRRGGPVTWRRAERAAKQEPSTCFGDFDIQKIRTVSFGFFLYDGDLNPFASGGSNDPQHCKAPFAGGADRGKSQTNEQRGGASSKGILIKSSQAIEALAHTEIVASDKTGTLTHGKFRVIGIHPFNTMTGEALLALAAQAEAHSSHPAALGILAAYHESGAEPLPTATSHTTVAGRGVKAVIGEDTVLVGNAAMMHDFGISPTCVEAESTTCTVHVAKNDEYLGSIVLADTLKEDAAPALQKMRVLGVREIHILTGDTEAAAASVAQALGVNGCHAALMPDEKMQCAQTLKEQCSPRGTLLFIGDGINDAPLLAAADVGCAMGALGTDAAMDAADIVIMNDSPEQAANAIQIAKKTVRIAKQNIFFALVVKCLILLLGALGITGMWSAVFGDVGVCILCILNAARCAKFKTK